MHTRFVPVTSPRVSEAAASLRAQAQQRPGLGAAPSPSASADPRRGSEHAPHPPGAAAVAPSPAVRADPTADPPQLQSRLHACRAAPSARGSGSRWSAAPARALPAACRCSAASAPGPVPPPAAAQPRPAGTRGGGGSARAKGTPPGTAPAPAPSGRRSRRVPARARHMPARVPPPAAAPPLAGAGVSPGFIGAAGCQSGCPWSHWCSRLSLGAARRWRRCRGCPAPPWAGPGPDCACSRRSGVCPCLRCGCSNSVWVTET